MSSVIGSTFCGARRSRKYAATRPRGYCALDIFFRAELIESDRFLGRARDDSRTVAFARRSRGPHACERIARGRAAGPARDAVRRGGQGARGRRSAANAEQLAPATYQRAAEAYAAAENDLARGRPQDRVRTDAAAAAKAFRQAKDAAEIASVTLASMIKTRADATKANAATFATQQWASATERFDSAAQAPRSRRHSRRAQPRGRGRGALSRRGAHVDQSAVSEPDARAARRSRSGPRVALRAEDLRERALAARASREGAQREPLRHRPAAQPRAAGELRGAARDLPRQGDQHDARGQSLDRGRDPGLRRRDRADRRGRGRGRSARQGRRAGHHRSRRLHRAVARAGRAVASGRDGLAQANRRSRGRGPQPRPAARRRIAGTFRARAARSKPRRMSASNSRRSRTCSSATRPACSARATG